MADFPSMVCLLVAGALRPLPQIERLDGVAVAGLAAGFAVGIKPANAIFLGGPRRRSSSRVAAAAALPARSRPALLTLALWKERGLGSIPLFALDEVRSQLGVAPSPPSTATSASTGTTSIGTWTGLREWFYSARLLQWPPFAGPPAVARRSLPVTALLTGWFGALLLVKGSTSLHRRERQLLPLHDARLPAYFLLAASIPLLIPTLATRRDRPTDPRKVGRRSCAASAITVTAITLPLAAHCDPSTRREGSPRQRHPDPG